MFSPNPKVWGQEGNGMRWLHVFFLTAVLLLAGVFVCDAHPSQNSGAYRLSLPQARGERLLHRHHVFTSRKAAVGRASAQAIVVASYRITRSVAETLARHHTMAFARSEFNPSQVQLSFVGQRQEKKGVHYYFERPGHCSGLSLDSLLAVFSLFGHCNDAPQGERGVPGTKPDDPRADPCSLPGERFVAV